MSEYTIGHNEVSEELNYSFSSTVFYKLEYEKDNSCRTLSTMTKPI